MGACRLNFRENPRSTFSKTGIRRDKLIQISLAPTKDDFVYSQYPTTAYNWANIQMQLQRLQPKFITRNK